MIVASACRPTCFVPLKSTAKPIGMEAMSVILRSILIGNADREPAAGPDQSSQAQQILKTQDEILARINEITFTLADVELRGLTFVGKLIDEGG
jgi:hypothetical protein